MNTSLKLYPKSCFQNAVYKNLVLEYKSIQFIETLLKLPFLLRNFSENEKWIGHMLEKKNIYIYIRRDIYYLWSILSFKTRWGMLVNNPTETNSQYEFY